jgi:hypothetical protein
MMILEKGKNSGTPQAWGRKIFDLCEESDYIKFKPFNRLYT